MNFAQLREQIFEHHKRSEWHDALLLIEQHEPSFATSLQLAHLIFWRACFLCLSNQPENALRELQQGVERGLWWSEARLRYDDDLRVLQGGTAYEELIAECVKRHKQEEALGGTAARLIAQPDASTSIPYPCIIALHGYAGNAETTLPDWSPLSEHGWLVAAVQSSQIADMDGFHWMDEGKARQDIQQNIAELAATFPLNPDRLVLSGTSNGGRTALLLALDGSFRAESVVSVGGSLRDETIATLDWQSIRKSAPLRLLLIAGELDERPLDRLTNQAKLFEAHGLDVTLQIIPGMGHSVPTDLAERLLTWLL